MSAQLSTAIVGRDVVSTVRTYSTVDATPLPGRRPLVVLSPGFGMTRLVSTALAEELASRGYVVAAVDHTYEAAVEFPGGRLQPCLNCSGQGSPAVVPSRVKDLRFVLDRLTGSQTGLPIDSSRITVVGHAMGGAPAVEMLSEDLRVDAVVQHGRHVPHPADPAAGASADVATGRPVADGRGTPAPNWVQRWSNLAGWRRWLSVPSAGHLSFTDPTGCTAPST
jgi:predicted dienelactone hydrolase